VFKENYIITGQIVCESGLHIGDSTDGIDIGGSDSPIIRDSITDYPYIPGSSLKGKLRTLLELSDKLSSESVIANKGKVSTDENCIATKLFGLTPREDDDVDDKNYQTRIIIRDSHPTKDTIKITYKIHNKCGWCKKHLALHLIKIDKLKEEKLITYDYTYAKKLNCGAVK